MATAERNDPYLSARFHVEITGLVVAGFSDASGLQIETETEDYREGGVNDYVHKLPKISKQSNIILKRGITDSDVLWKWHKEVVSGKFERRLVRIILYDSEGNEKRHWICRDAYPVKWAGPEFKADNATVAIETLDLAHHGLDKG
ncbi:MAG: phage tail protein [bacterium]|nr:phage tail protein [bacterium]